MNSPRPKSIRGAIVLATAIGLSSATTVFFLWRYSLKAVIVTGLLFCAFYLLVRWARAIEVDSIIP